MPAASSAFLSVEDKIYQQGIGPPPGKTREAGAGGAADAKAGDDAAHRVDQFAAPCSGERVPGIPGRTVTSRVTWGCGCPLVGPRDAAARLVLYVDIYVYIEACSGTLKCVSQQRKLQRAAAGQPVGQPGELLCVEGGFR